jgi:hypothetical protein
VPPCRGNPRMYRHLFPLMPVTLHLVSGPEFGGVPKSTLVIAPFRMPTHCTHMIVHAPSICGAVNTYTLRRTAARPRLLRVRAARAQRERAADAVPVFEVRLEDRLSAP